MPTLPPAVLPGAVAGAVALVVFATLHAIWIAPIWPMLALVPLAAAVGAIAAVPFDAVAARGALPPAPLDGISFAALLLITLVPTAIVGVIAGPLDRDHITAAGLLLPLVLAAPTGAALGLVVTGSVPGAVGLAVGALVLALTFGHNLPFFPIGSPGWIKAYSLLVAVELSAGLAFGATRALLLAGPTPVAQ